MSAEARTGAQPSIRSALMASPGARTSKGRSRRTKQERQADDEEALTRLLDGADRDEEEGVHGATGLHGGSDGQMGDVDDASSTAGAGGGMQSAREERPEVG